MSIWTSSFSSKLNFSLTRKRLALIGKNTSASSLYFKALPVLVAFAFSPFLFFEQKELVNEPTEIDWQEYWASLSYSDVNLEFQRIPFIGDSISILQHIPRLALLDGKIYTGVQNTYEKDTDLLEHSSIYVDGLIVHAKYFDSEGTESSSLDYFYNPQKKKLISTRYYQYSKLSLETIYSSPSHNGAMVFKHWNERGYLEMLSILDKRDPNITYGEVIRYDKNGTVTFHERYEGLELVEKIK